MFSERLNQDVAYISYGQNKAKGRMAINKRLE
jgi:hypothetical protein